MKNEFLKFSSRRILFSAAMVSALLAGSPQMAFAEANDVQAVMQTSVVKGRILDSTGEPIIGASIIEKGTTNPQIATILKLLAPLGKTLAVVPLKPVNSTT